MRILHLGLGAFHRAHQAVFLQRLIDCGDSRWHIAAGNICPGQEAVEAALVAQAGVYTVETVAPDGLTQYQSVLAIREVVPFEPALARLIELGANARTRIVSFTVTEAGYEPGPANALYPALAAILRERRRRGTGKLTMLCCDNLRHNGQVARAGLLAFLAGDADLRDWVLAHTTWPNSMVDRITPRSPAALRGRVLAATGHDDAAPVTAERWLQWVIEDEFCNNRPAWERAGVQMVAEVAPYEEAKIRILNAGHSAIAWAGTLRGHTFIHEAVSDPRVQRIAHDYISEQVIPCLAAAGSPVDLPAYRDSVLARFANAALGDTCQRVVADSWAKLPGFIVPTLRERLAAGASGAAIGSGALLPALMLAFLQRWHRGELDAPYEDQAMDPAIAHAICAAADPLAAFCAEPSLWGDLASDARLLAALRAAWPQAEALRVTAPRIAVLGEALIDAFPGGDVIGGAPFNVARNLAALGEPPLMLTRIGEDARGDALAAEFQRYGMSTAGLQRDPARPTGVVTVVMNEATRQHRFEIGADCAWDALDAAAVQAALAEAPPALIYFGTLAQRDPVSRAAIRAGLEAAGPATRFLDLNLRNGLPEARRIAEESLQLADVLKVNEDELSQLQAWFGLAPEALAAQFALRRLIVTRGAEGWSCFEGEAGGWRHGAAPAVSVRDTVGAGDAFAAVALLGMAQGWPLAEAMARAAAHAAQACGFEGALGWFSGETAGRNARP